MRKLAKIPAGLLALLGKLKARVVTAAREAWLMEPARVVSLTVSAIVALVAAFGLVVTPQSVEVIVALILPVLFSGELTRGQVTPKGPHRP